MNLGSLIELLREKKGFSQRQLAMYSGISNTEISALESGKRKKPNPDILKKISKYLDISYEQLMEAAGYIPGENNLSITDENLEILKVAINFSKDELTCMLNIKEMGVSISELCNFATNLLAKK